MVTVGMLREVAKDIDIVAASYQGRQNIKRLLSESADELERLSAVAEKMASSVADSAGKITIGGYGDQPQMLPKEAADIAEPEPAPPTEKELAKEMAPTQKSKKSRK